jgi:hypothetical protein
MGLKKSNGHGQKKEKAYFLYCNSMRNRHILIITLHKGTHEFTYINSYLIYLNQKTCAPFLLLKYLKNDNYT